MRPSPPADTGPPTDTGRLGNRRRASRAVAAGVAALALGLGACADDGGDDPAAFCAAVMNTDDLDAVFADLDPADVPAAVVAFSAARDAEAALAATAPDAVRADVELLVTYLDDLVAGLEATEPGSGRPPIYDDLAPRADAVASASDRIELYVGANCTIAP